MHGEPKRVFTVGEVASWIDGTVHGDAQQPIRAARPIDEAGPGDITFLEGPIDERSLADCRASAVIVRRAVARPDHIAALIEVPQPLSAFCTVFQTIYELYEEPPRGIDPRACVAPSAILGEDVYVGPGAVIGDGTRIGNRVQIHAGTVVGASCVIGDDCILNPNVTIYPRTRLGCRVIVHSGAVIGADGFGYRSGSFGHAKVPHMGGVLIEDDVEIGANTTIDRGTFGLTVIGRGTKIDNQVQIAHNCKIGRYNLIAAQAGIAGSSKTGDHVVIAGQAGIRDHVQIGDGVVIGAMSGVMTSIPAGERVVGLPAEPEGHARRIYAIFHRLPDLRQQVLDLGRRMQALEQRVCGTPGNGMLQRKSG